MTAADRITAACRQVEEMLLAKNEAYGDSAFNPIRVFSKADPVEQIRVRLDDKLSRLVRGAPMGEDTELDLAGYLILLIAARGAEPATQGEALLDSEPVKPWSVLTPWRPHRFFGDQLSDFKCKTCGLAMHEHRLRQAEFLESVQNRRTSGDFPITPRQTSNQNPETPLTS